MWLLRRPGGLYVLFCLPVAPLPLPSPTLQGHCVVCVSEGAGQDMIEGGGDEGVDETGRPRLKDVGPGLKRERCPAGWRRGSWACVCVSLS